ncbi:MAG: DNA repair protein RecO [Patescibacteria group bacterium]|nr:DNA repair protein RecO [Patescibacteria group bacterium]MDD5715675.1 DNA repair protein RecO [Patescibacteria group bacterium]
MGSYSTQGILLKHQPYREADRLVTVFTKEFGRLTMIARGSRKVLSKLAGNLQPFTVADLTVVRGRTFDIITAAEVVAQFRVSSWKLPALYLAGRFSDIVCNATKDRQRDVRVYELVLEVFAALSVPAVSVGRLHAIAWYGVWRLLTYLGYGPHMHACTACKRGLEEGRILFSYQRGGLVCGQCHAERGTGRMVSANTIKLIRFVCRHTLPALLKVRAASTTRNECTVVTSEYCNYTLERDCKLLSVLRVR